jgi:hypothetical protein
MEYAVSKHEWKDDSAVTFECEVSVKHGFALDVVWH